MNTASITEALLLDAKKNGAEQADVILIKAQSSSVSCRNGILEESEFSESKEFGLRVMIDKRQALVSSSDLSRDSIQRMAERACAMAKLMPQDPYIGLGEYSLFAIPDLDLVDRTELTPDQLLARVQECESIGLDNKQIINSGGASASFGKLKITYANSNGFLGEYDRTNHGISLILLAGKDDKMQRDYDYSYATHFDDLKSIKDVAHHASSRTIAKLNPQKIASCQVPIIYDPRVAASLLHHLASAISGAAIARGMSFLRDALHSEMFAKNITVTDDPLRKRGHKSHPFDAEGIESRKTNFIKDGVLTSWILDTRSANQLNLKSTGHASRGISNSPTPSPSNLYFEKGTLSPKELMTDINEGFYVTELMGQGVNPITGDYSRGASGFWIKDGKIDFPVSEITIAGNLKEMYKKLAVANDLAFETGTDAPTIRIDGMTIAGR